MRKLVYAFTIIAAAASTAAVAGEIKQEKKAAVPMVKATVMSDAEMDKISAGDNTLPIPPDPLGRGEGTAHWWGSPTQTATPAYTNWTTTGIPAANDATGKYVGLGLGTAFGVVGSPY